jgi:cytoskeleton protein RodZ
VLGTWQGSRKAVGMRVGADLKAARKKAGLTVEVISKRTKINVSKLVALEKNDFKKLPTGLYLFSAVRAYAREVHIDPEPIVERLREDFAEKDALDALHALDATGALDAKNAKQEQSNLLRNAAIVSGVVLMAAAGAGAYFQSISRIAHEEGGVSLSTPTPVATVATAIDMPQPQQAAGAAHRPAPTTTHRPKPRTTAVIPELQETVANEVPSPAETEEPADSPANTEEPGPEAPVPAP